MPQRGLVKKQLFGAAHLETIGAENQKLELYWESLYIQKHIGLLPVSGQQSCSMQREVTHAHAWFAES